MIFDYSYRLSHIWFSTCFPVVFHFMFYSFLICTVFFPIFFLYVRLLFVPHSYLHLFSICSSIIFRLFFICFQFVLRLFSTFLIFVFHLSPFILRSFFISSSFVLHLFFSFIFHLFSIYFLFYSPFIFPVHLPFFHEAKYGSCAVKAQYRFVAWSIFRLKFPRSQRMDVKAKRKVFRERLCTSDLVPR